MTRTSDSPHAIERVRREARRRRVVVQRAHALTPRMIRVEFASPDLADFSSLGPDDHVKIFVPDPSSPSGVASRDFTPRAFDNARRALTIDFALHERGPASDWARAAKPGDEIEIGGPRGSMIVADDFDYYLLIGDETALPAIGRRVEGLRAGVPVTTIVIVDDPAERQTFETRADWRPLWLHRAGQTKDDASLLLEALNAWTPPAGDGYVWIAAEGRVARELKTRVIDERQHPKGWMRAAGYWVRGAAGASEKIEA